MSKTRGLTERINQERERFLAQLDAETISLERVKVAGYIEFSRHINLKDLMAHPDFPWDDKRLEIAVPLLLRLQELARGAK